MRIDSIPGSVSVYTSLLLLVFNVSATAQCPGQLDAIDV